MYCIKLINYLASKRVVTHCRPIVWQLIRLHHFTSRMRACCATIFSHLGDLTATLSVPSWTKLCANQIFQIVRQSNKVEIQRASDLAIIVPRAKLEPLRHLWLSSRHHLAVAACHFQVVAYPYPSPWASEVLETRSSALLPVLPAVAAPRSHTAGQRAAPPARARSRCKWPSKGFHSLDRAICLWPSEVPIRLCGWWLVCDIPLDLRCDKVSLQSTSHTKSSQHSTCLPSLRPLRSPNALESRTQWHSHRERTGHLGDAPFGYVQIPQKKKNRDSLRLTSLLIPISQTFVWVMAPFFGKTISSRFDPSCLLPSFDKYQSLRAKALGAQVPVAQQPAGEVWDETKPWTFQKPKAVDVQTLQDLLELGCIFYLFSYFYYYVGTERNRASCSKCY